MAINLSKAQFTLAISKSNSHWQYQNPILIGNIKTQFLLAISKLSSRWQCNSPVKKKKKRDQIFLRGHTWPTYAPNSHHTFQLSPYPLAGSLISFFFFSFSLIRYHSLILLCWYHSSPLPPPFFLARSPENSLRKR